jgi:hypothetical protein
LFSAHRLAGASRIAVAAVAALSTALVAAPSRPAGAAAPSSGQTRGVPWTGARGVTETVGRIMARTGAGAAKARASLPVRQLPAPVPAPSASRASSSAGGSRAAVAPSAPQNVTTSFLGGQFSDSGFVPPDSMGAAGPSQFLVGINGLMRSFQKSGAADGALNTTTNNFFASVLGGKEAGDPRVRYDRLSGRWFITMISVDPTAGSLQPVNRLLLAVSSGGTIASASSFTFFAFQQDAVTPVGNDAGCFLDYDTLGVDANALYVGANFFCIRVVNGVNQPVFVDSGAFVIRKSSVLGAGPMVVTAFRNLTNGTSGGPSTPQGADNDDPSATTGYLAGVDVHLFSHLELRRITDPGGTPSISGNLDIPVATTTNPIPVPHMGSDGRPLDAVDERLMNAVVRNGQLWTIHNIQVDATGAGSSTGGRDGTRWYQLGNLDTTPTVTQFGTVFDPSAANPLSWWMPSINVTQQGHVAIGGSVAGATHFADAWTAGRLATDPAGTMQTPTVYTSANAAYNPVFQSFPDNPHRWGDFSFTSLDPNDGMTMWTIQEYTNAANSWGVQVARLSAPPPATIVSVVPASVPTGLPSVNVRITGTSVSGSGYFDPGPGFNRLFVGVTGGVFVRSIRIDSTTSLVVNLDTSTASTGFQDVEVVNPDGQFSRGSLLNITPATGMLRVTTNPPLPSQLTSVSGVPRDSWGITWAAVEAGSYTIVATHVEGWTEPAPQPVTVTAGQTTALQENFTQRGELRVITNPAVAAPISVDGTTRNDWGMFTDLPTGSHEVCFGPTAGFDPPNPACQTVMLTAGQQTTLTGNYTSDAQAAGPQGTGQLRVTTSPALPSQILVNGVPMDSWGLTWVDLAPGTYTVTFTHVEGWTEPELLPVTVTAGQTTVVQGSFVQRGELHVVTSPAVPAQITMDGTVMNNWGVFTDVPVGSHQVCFGWAPSAVAPPCQTVTVTAGALTTITGTYTPGP